MDKLTRTPERSRHRSAERAAVQLRTEAGGTGTGRSPSLEDKVVQLREGVRAAMGADARAAIRGTAQRGVADGGAALPHLARIQASFGRHDVASVRMHQGGATDEACRDLGAHGYAMGDHVALRSGADLFTVAHEAAHVVQQRSGIALSEGVGRAGDVFEQHADQVAQRVVQGKSAEDLLERFAGAGRSAAPASGVQLRQFIGTNDAESVSIVQGVATGSDAGAILALRDAMAAAAQSRTASGMDHIRARVLADTYELTMSPSETDGQILQLERRLVDISNRTPEPTGDIARDAGGRGAGPGERGGQAREAPAGRSRQVTRSRSLRGMAALRDFIGDFVLSGVPTVGSTLGGNLSLRIAVDGIVLVLGLELEAERTQDDKIGFRAAVDFGVGGGTASNNVTLNAPQSLRLRDANPTATAVGNGISMALRAHLVHLGEGPIPDPALAMIAQALGGAVGGVAVAGDSLIRWWEGAFGDDGFRNPCYEWLADRLWGRGFARAACRSMGEGASVESTRGVAVEGRAGEAGEESRSVAGRAQADRVVSQTCGPNGAVTESTSLRTTFSLQAGPLSGSVTIGWPPRTKLEVAVAGEIEGVPSSAAMVIDALMQGVAAALHHYDERDVPPVTVSRALVTAGMSQAFRFAPGSTVRIGAELELENRVNKLKIIFAQEARVEGSDGAIAEVRGGLVRGISREFIL